MSKLSGRSNDYRMSHAKVGYGKLYSNFYSKGTYSYCIWQEEQKLLHKIFRDFDLYKKKNILDFATGTGRIINFLVNNFPDAKIWGVDVSKEMLKYATKKFRANHSIKFLLGDLTTDGILQRKLKKQEINIITAFRFFTNAQESLRLEVLRSFKKISDNFYLVFNIHQRPLSFFFIYKMYRRVKSIITQNSELNRFNLLSLSHIKKILEGEGYTLVKTYNVTWTIPAMFKFFPKNCNLLLKIVKLPLRNFIPSETIVVAEYKQKDVT